jgi:hypothetical protein
MRTQAPALAEPFLRARVPMVAGVLNVIYGVSVSIINGLATYTEPEGPLVEAR